MRRRGRRRSRLRGCEHRRPAYTQRRKFGYFVAAANDDIAAQLFAIIRQVKRNKDA